jgi:DNA repair exonuclease SbcCD ATPase subunit
MSFKIKYLTVKNFMSVGNSTQAVNFDRKDLTLVLGENIDLGGDDTGARNGTGKTTIINALSYALYGTALTNIRKDNLVNKTNTKAMLVTIDFEVNGVDYKIERGRKPNVLKFYIGEQEQEAKDDNSQGDSRETQQEIERLLGMSHEMFKHVVALNTYTEPFLALKPNDQRAIIEQLLGITLLSEKAEALKEQSKATKDAIQQEEANIKAVADANKRIEEQIEATQRRQMLWLTKRKDDVAKLQTALDELLKLDIDAEIVAHRELSTYNQKSKDLTDLDKAIARSEQDLSREVKGIANLTGDIATLREHKCNTCGQDLHDSKHEELLVIKESKLKDAETQQGVHAGDLEALILAKQELGELGSQPKTFYDNEGLAIQHRSSIAAIQEQITSKTAEEDPYTEQIADMKATALAEIDYTKMNELSRVKDHQEFLYKLLTNKDSYIRKRIIDQNLSYLNARLSQYLDRIGLPHTVVFMNDLSVNITELGRELDFDNLSRGERNRLILSLSWSFRDVWESLYQPINLLFIDELIDSGMDASGVENAMAILKKMSRDSHKSIWLVSHRDELGGRVNNVLTVVKENGFTSYNTDVEIT